MRPANPARYLWLLASLFVILLLGCDTRRTRLEQARADRDRAIREATKERDDELRMVFVSRVALRQDYLDDKISPQLAASTDRLSRLAGSPEVAEKARLEVEARYKADCAKYDRMERDIRERYAEKVLEIEKGYNQRVASIEAN